MANQVTIPSDHEINDKLDALKRVTLEKVKFSVGAMISPDLFRDASIDVLIDSASRQLVVQLTSHLLNQSHDVVEQIEVPSSWFQSFKMDVIVPLLKRLHIAWRPRIKTGFLPVITRHYNLCPHIAVPGTADHAEFMVRVPKSQPTRSINDVVVSQ